MADPNLRIALRVSADHRNKGEGEQHHDQDDLASRQPELSFTICLDCETVQQCIEDDAH